MCDAFFVLIHCDLLVLFIVLRIIIVHSCVPLYVAGVSCVHSCGCRCSILDSIQVIITVIHTNSFIVCVGVGEGVVVIIVINIKEWIDFSVAHVEASGVAAYQVG